MHTSRRDALLTEYREVNSNFRMLTDIRFKLLGLLPFSAAAAAALKGESLGFGGFMFSLFGLVVTSAIVSYNARNDQLYDELIGRAASIERSLGIPDGGFANRPRPWLTYSGWGHTWTIEHRDAVAAVYAATCALWTTGVLTPAFELCRAAYVATGLPHWIVRQPEPFVAMAAALVSIVLVVKTLHRLRAQRKCQEDELRVNARKAVLLAIGRPIQDVANDEALLRLCDTLAGTCNSDVVKRRAEFYAKLAPESLGHFLMRGSPELVAANAIGLLTDLPARWLFDCATNRRGQLKEEADDSGPPVNHPGQSHLNFLS